MITQRLTFPIVDCPADGDITAALRRELEGVPGVVRAYVNPSTEMAYVQADPSLTDIEVLVRAAEHAGLHAGPPSRR
jgi:hypothetical protein